MKQITIDFFPAVEMTLLFVPPISRLTAGFVSFIHAPSLVPPAPCMPPPPYLPLLFSMSSPITVGLAFEAIGTKAIPSGALATGKPMLFRYRYNVTNLLSTVLSE